MRFALRIFPVLPLLALSAIAVGQQSADSPRLYHVEIIAFELNDGSRFEEDFFHGDEQLKRGPMPRLLEVPSMELESLALPAPGPTNPEPPANDEPATVGAMPPQGAPPGSTVTTGAINAPANSLPQDRLELFELPAGSTPAAPAIAAPQGFRVLARDELELGDARARLNNLRAYRVLVHTGWVQAGLDQNLAVPLDLKLLGVSNPRGTIQVYLGSYLHAVADLEFVDGRGSFWRSSQEAGLNPLEYAGRYSLNTEHNRIGLGRLVYLDHPLFGLILRIIRAPEPEEDEQSGQPAA